MNDSNPSKKKRSWYRFSLRMLLLPPVVMAAGCGGMSAKEVGMIVVYEVYAEKTGVAGKPNATDMQTLTVVIDRRLNSENPADGHGRAG